MNRTYLSSAPQYITVTNENDDIFKKLNANGNYDQENRLWGMVSDKGTGKPIRDSLVKITDSNFNTFHQSVSDSEGRFSLHTGSLSSFRLIAAKKGYLTYTSEVLNTAAIPKKEIVIMLSPAEAESGVIYGSVRDYKGKALQNVRVSIYRNEDSNPADITISDQEGSFLFDHVEPGIYRISCQSPNHDSFSRMIRHTSDRPVHIMETIYLKRSEIRGTLYGTIADQKGAPVPNAAVILFNSENVPLGFTRTNDKGVYLFYDLEMGSYRILAK